MNVFFAPAIGLMNRLRYAAKFISIGLIVFLALVPLVWLQYQGSTQQFEFNDKEHVGVLWITPAGEFLNLVQQHRVLAVAVAVGEASLRPQLAEVEGAADAKASLVDTVDAKYGVTLETTEAWKIIKSAWARAKAAGGTDEADAAHAEVVKLGIDAILNKAGNASNLILDPDLDSYWLMDIYVIKVHALGDTLSSLGSRALRGGDPAAKAFETAGLYRIALNTVSDINDVDLATVYKEFMKPQFGQKADLQRNVEGPAKTLTVEANDVAEKIRTLGDGMAKKAVVTETLGALKANADFFTKVAPELDWL